MQIIIRLDDITPDMNWERFLKVKELLTKYNIKPIIGVVPDCLDANLSRGEKRANFWDLMIELNRMGWDIAQHGTNHVYETEDAGLLGINPFSEFAGLPYEKQLSKLRMGRDILKEKGIDTLFFMAPGHTFDINTLKALKELGFSAITDGLAKEAYIREGILCIPCRLSAYDKLKGLDTICLHTNNMSDDDISKLEEFITQNRNSITSFSEVMKSCKARDYDRTMELEEKRCLNERERRKRAAGSERIAWYLAYTNHKSSKIKWIKRALFLPLLLTNKYKKN